MFEATYRVALMHYERQSDGSLIFRLEHLSRRVFLAAKPAVGETVAVPFFDKCAPTRFVVAEIVHHTHLDPPQALSYLPEYLGEVHLVVEGRTHAQRRGVSSYLKDGDRHNDWGALLSVIALLGWTVVEPST